MVSRLYCGLHLARSHIDVSRTSHLSQDQACACLTWITETSKILQWHRPREKFHLLSLKNSQKHTSICNVLDVSPRTSLARGQVAGVVHPADKRGQTADKQIGSRRGLQRELAFVFLTSDTLQLFQGRGNPRAFRQLPDARPRASTWEPHMEASKRSTNTAACST